MRAATAAASVGRNSYAGSAAGSAYSLASGGAGSESLYAGAGYVSNGGYGSNGAYGSNGLSNFAGSAAGSAYSLASGGAGSGTSYAGAGYVSNGGYGSNGVYGSNGLSNAAVSGSNSLSGYVALYNGAAPPATPLNNAAGLDHYFASVGGGDFGLVANVTVTSAPNVTFSVGFGTIGFNIEGGYTPGSASSVVEGSSATVHGPSFFGGSVTPSGGFSFGLGTPGASGTFGVGLEQISAGISSFGNTMSSFGNSISSAINDALASPNGLPAYYGN